MTETDAEFLKRVATFEPTEAGGFHPIRPETLDRLLRLARKGSEDGTDKRPLITKLYAAFATAEANLENAKALLKRWESYGCPDCGGDCSSANPPVSCCIMRETRAAIAKAQPPTTGETDNDN